MESTWGNHGQVCDFSFPWTFNSCCGHRAALAESFSTILGSHRSLNDQRRKPQTNVLRIRLSQLRELFKSSECCHLCVLVVLSRFEPPLSMISSVLGRLCRSSHTMSSDCRLATAVAASSGGGENHILRFSWLAAFRMDIVIL
jgi:hypothetical protein